MKKLKPAQIALIIILGIYSVLSFYKLGNMKNPQTCANLKKGEKLVYKINSEQIPEKMMVYSGYNESEFTIYYSNNYENEDEYVTRTTVYLDYSNVFKWNEEYINAPEVKPYYIIIESERETTSLGELKIYDTNDKEIELTPMGEKEKILLDEQEDVPKNYSYMNSTYFDEIYFPRTAYEMLNNLSIYEYTHPPLGKIILSIPIHFLGLTPFAYRLCGNIAGILIILVIYKIAKQLFKRERYALFSAIIMALDGMHFVQTRIGTVDSLLLLFCLTSFMFFLKYLYMPKEESIKIRKIPLLLSGTFWGMAISVKWTSAFVGLGMGILYLIKTIKDREINLKLLLWSVLSFIIIPIAIYVASYIPIINNPNAQLYYAYENKNGETVSEYITIKDVGSFIKYQKAMYDYHSKLEATHPYTSKWYEWPIMKRPLWFYIGRFDNDKIGTIACMGNPAIWWLSTATAIFTLIYTIIKKDKEGLIILVMIIATWITYAFIGRIMFIYHYFITLPYMMLTIVFTISKLAKWKSKVDYCIPALCAIFLAFFIYFFPVYSGMPVRLKYIKATEWFNSWEYDGLPR